jgi:hypothetical protein
MSRITCFLRWQLKLRIEVWNLSQLIEVDADIDEFAVGGIYSVLKSKAPVTTAEYGERYTLIGPLNRASVNYSKMLELIGGETNM